MLVEFSVRNFRSFHDRVTLSMAVDETTQSAPLLPIAIIYGANASGKSNLLAAISVMRRMVIESFHMLMEYQSINVAPFLLNAASASEPSEFEMTFRVDDSQYRYGFAVDRRAVRREWLSLQEATRETPLFTRVEQQIEVHRRALREWRRLARFTRPNALFLAVAAQMNIVLAQRLTAWFDAMDIVAATDVKAAMTTRIDQWAQSPYRAMIAALIQRLDVGIEQLDLRPAAQRHRLVAAHQRFAHDGTPIAHEAFDVEACESAGTHWLLTIAPAIARALNEGGLLVIDDFDAHLHPLLALELIRLFCDSTTNPRHAQLVAVVRHTSLLRADIARREQVWFVERSRTGSSHVYSLLEFHVDASMDCGAAHERNYLLGRYGATPFPGDLRELFLAERSAAASAASEDDPADRQRQCR